MIQEVIEAKVSVMHANGDEFTFGHSSKDWQNIEADEKVLPCVYLDMPVTYDPILSDSGHFKRSYVGVIMFVYPSKLEDNPDQRYASFQKCEAAQREFQLLCADDPDTFELFTVGRCLQAMNIFDRNIDAVIMPFVAVLRNSDETCATPAP